jgi:Phage protein
MPKYRRPAQAVSAPTLRSANDACTNWRQQGPAAEVLAMPAPAPRPAPPVLEVNRRPLRDLEQALEVIGQPALLRALDIHRTTLRRWQSRQVKIPGDKVQVIRMLLGHLPGTDDKWPGWRFGGGFLISPSGDRFEAGQVLSLILLRQQLSAQQQEVERLRIRLAIAEQAVDRLAPAANEPLAGRHRA